MIGLVDYDLQTTKNSELVPPNLEIMKLATYYRGEENTFCRLVGLEETELSCYDKIYFFSEADEMPKIPYPFLRTDNVLFGGTAFTNGKYVPFKNDIIDFTIPRPAIYKEFLKDKYRDGIKTKVIEHILDDSYYRLYAGDSKLPIPPVKKGKRFFIYDSEFFYPDWEATIKKIIERSPSSINFIHPIVCHTLAQYFALRQQPKIARTNKIILDTNIPLDDVNYMLNKYKNLFLADIFPTSNICIPLGGSYLSTLQYYIDLKYKLNLLFSFWSKGIEMKISYVKPKLGFTNPIQELELLIEKWTYSKSKAEKSINKRIRKPKKKDDIVIEARQRDRFLQFHPNCKDLFDQTYNKLSQGGYWHL